jgi:hypothetical protein
MKTPKSAAKSAANTLKMVGEPVPDEFKIEDGVPLPTNRTTKRPAKYFPFERLSSGQSFLVAKEQRKGLRPALSRHYKATGQKKTIVMREQADGSVRVWRK